MPAAVRSLFKTIACLCLAVFLPATAWSGVVSQARVWAEPAARASFEELPLPDDWRAVEGSRAAEWLPAGAYWLRWSPDPSTARRGALRLTEGTSSRLEVWLLDGAGRLVAAHDSRSADDTGLPYGIVPWPRGHRGELTVIARQTGALVLVYAPAVVQAAPAPPPKSPAHVQALAAPWPALMALAVLGLIGLLGAIATRDLAHLAAGALAAAFGFWILQSHGLAGRWLWPEHPDWNVHAAAAALAAIAALSAWTARTVLADTGRADAFAARVLGILVMAGLVVTATVSLVPTTASIVASGSLILACGVVVAWRVTARMLAGDRTAIWPALATAPLLALAARDPLIAAGLDLPDVLAARDTGHGVLAVSAGLAAVCAWTRHYTPARLHRAARTHFLEEQTTATRALEKTVAARTFELEMANEKLARMTRIDGLTGVFNRRHFDDQLRQTVAEAHAAGRTMAVVMIDLDHFKRLNDDHGHACGDECLILAGRLATAAMPQDQGLVARYGGEEFVALLGDCDTQEAMAFAEAVRRTIESAQPRFQGKTIRMSASLGVCCRRPESDTSGPAMLAAADAALYVAKRGGRNRVVENGDGRLDGAGASHIETGESSTGTMESPRSSQDAIPTPDVTPTTPA